MLSILLLAATAVAVPMPFADENIALDNGLVRGTWGDPEFCQDGTTAFAFEIKYADLGHIDDTAMNGMRLYCQRPDGTLMGYVTSLEGKWGHWLGMRTCSSGSLLVGMQGNVVGKQGTFGDDLGMDNLRMECGNGDVLDGMYGVPNYDQAPVLRQQTVVDGRDVEAIHVKFSKEVRDHGDWGSWARCSPGKVVCGLQTRVEHDDIINDDAGMCDVVLYCCNA